VKPWGDLGQGVEPDRAGDLDLHHAGVGGGNRRIGAPAGGATGAAGTPENAVVAERIE
jgi:hypothetical protein